MITSRLAFVAIFVSMVVFQVSGQKFAKSQFTLFNYSLELNEKVKAELSKYESYIKYKTDKDQDKLEAILYHSVYDVVSKEITDSLGVFILPVNSMSTSAKYNDYGYPQIGIQKALKLGNTKYFFKLIALIDLDAFNNDGSKLPENAFRPKVTITIELYNKFGYLPIQTSEGTASANGVVDLSPEYLAGLNFVDNSQLKKTGQEAFVDIIKRATFEAVYGLKHKSNKNK